jgi:cation diffusion facilitator family transporter
VVAAFGANLAIAVPKFAAAVLTGSAAMLSEGWHSLADTGNQGMLLYGMRAARRPADEEHPFGRGKESFFWSFMVAVVLFTGGAFLSISHGIDALRHPHELESLVPSFIVLGIAIAAEGASFLVARREFNIARGSRQAWRSIRETKNMSLVVVLLEDSAALSGLSVALIGTTLVALTGNTMWDAFASLAIGVLLAAVAIVLAVETKALLIGEAASRDDRAAIRSRLLAMPAVSTVGRLLTMQMGPSEILVNVEVDFQEEMSKDDIETAIVEAEELIQQILPGARNVFVEYRSRHRG